MENLSFSQGSVGKGRSHAFNWNLHIHSFMQTCIARLDEVHPWLYKMLKMTLYPIVGWTASITSMSHLLVKVSLHVSRIETDRNPNFDYQQKPNILLNPKYSANCRIAEYRIVPTQYCKFVTIRFRQNFRFDFLQNILAEIGFGRTLLYRTIARQNISLRQASCWCDWLGSDLILATFFRHVTP